MRIVNQSYGAGELLYKKLNLKKRARIARKNSRRN